MADMANRFSISIYNFPRKHLARCLYGEENPAALRRIDAWLDGEVKMPVDIFYALSVQEPLIDVVKSLKDMYARYEVAKFKKNKGRNKGKRKYGKESQDDGIHRIQAGQGAEGQDGGGG